MQIQAFISSKGKSPFYKLALKENTDTSVLLALFTVQKQLKKGL